MSIYQLPDLPARIRVDLLAETGRELVTIVTTLPGDQWLDLIPWPLQHHADGDSPIPGGRRYKARRAAGVMIEFESRYGSWRM